MITNQPTLVYYVDYYIEKMSERNIRIFMLFLFHDHVRTLNNSRSLLEKY
jgi:hypothetical protein